MTDKKVKVKDEEPAAPESEAPEEIEPATPEAPSTWELQFPGDK